MTGPGARTRLLELLEELGGINGVRGAIVAMQTGAFENGKGSGFGAAAANDVAKTVRRMTVASATVGAPLEELIINFGPARMMVLPLDEDSTLVILLERDTAVAAVRSMLSVQLEEIRTLVSDDGAPEDIVEVKAPEADDEVASLMEGKLGEVLGDIERRFAQYMARGGIPATKAATLMREQMREWLLCCNPSPYTFPLLLDALAQLLEDSPETRSAFMTEVQEAMRGADIWAGKAAP